MLVAMTSKVNEKYPDIWEAQEGKCFYCERPLELVVDRYHRKRIATADHFIPVAHGGTRDNNIVLACGGCNNGANHVMPSTEHLARFVALYERIGRNAQSVRDRVSNWYAEA